MLHSSRRSPSLRSTPPSSSSSSLGTYINLAPPQTVSDLPTKTTQHAVESAATSTKRKAKSRAPRPLSSPSVSDLASKSAQDAVESPGTSVNRNANFRAPRLAPTPPASTPGRVIKSLKRPPIVAKNAVNVVFESASEEEDEEDQDALFWFKTDDEPPAKKSH